MSDMDKAFDKFVDEFTKCTKKSWDGDYFEISCVLGLWSVSGLYSSILHNQAVHYFKQYRDDGEYSSIIGGPSVLDKLKGANDD